MVHIYKDELHRIRVLRRGIFFSLLFALDPSWPGMHSLFPFLALLVGLGTSVSATSGVRVLMEVLHLRQQHCLSSLFFLRVLTFPCSFFGRLLVAEGVRDARDL